MLSKVMMVLIMILAFGTSLFFNGNKIQLDESTYGPSTVLLFSIPFTILLIITQFFLLTRVKRLSRYYTRFEKGLNGIFLVLTIFLFALHTALLLLASGYKLNPLLLLPIGVGLILMLTGNSLPRFKLDITDTSTPNYSPYKTYNSIVRPSSYSLFIGGSIMIFCVFLPDHLLLIGFFTILTLTLGFAIVKGIQGYVQNIHF
ncbi:hypothetical protein [Rossellomorea sp. BNER]|uniref:hypothetical protein n=1 Tax=Rossellomorea sp. BNER TaxID=2962031 RepID=UPI003AF1E3E2|nr:hypothetical protein [Rossellomorea sp. BNER]